MPHEIRQLYAYDRWANRRLLDAALALPPADLDRDLGSSFPSVRATLAHLLSSHWVWLERWLGRSPTCVPADWDLSTGPAIAALWREVEEAQRRFVEGLSAADLDRVVDYRNLAGTPYSQPLGDLLRHVVNHATYHRGQVVTMLRQLGATAPSTDLVQFYRERAAE